VIRPSLRLVLSDELILKVIAGLGLHPSHGRIVQLVNQHTASAGENIAGVAKENKLATIVDTKTAGQVPRRNWIQNGAWICLTSARRGLSHLEWEHARRKWDRT